MRGQSALAYLVMVAAVLTLAVTAVVIFQSMLSPAQAANIVLDDKYQASMAGIELPDYKYVYSGLAVHAPLTAVYAGQQLSVVPYDDYPAKHGTPVVEIGYYKAIDAKFDMQVEGQAMRLQSLRSRACEFALELLGVEYNEETAESIDLYCAAEEFGELTSESTYDEVVSAGTTAYFGLPPAARGQIGGINIQCTKTECRI